MRFDIVSIFPEFFSGIFSFGMIRRAIEGGQAEVVCHDLRRFTHDRHRTVDDRPFGGGEGMVLKPEPLAEAVESLGLPEKTNRAKAPAKSQSVILLSPQGRRFSQPVARELAGMERVVLLCGRYEGVDERVTQMIADDELSIGDYVLSGGEIAAAVVIEATVRLLPGVLGNEASAEFESFGPSDEAMNATKRFEGGNPAPRSTHGAGGLLDYPHYTRPAEFRGACVPEVLSKGNHEEIRRWRRERALEKTWRNRPDLLPGADLSTEDRRFLRELDRQSGRSGKDGN